MMKTTPARATQTVAGPNTANSNTNITAAGLSSAMRVQSGADAHGTSKKLVSKGQHYA